MNSSNFRAYTVYKVGMTQVEQAKHLAARQVRADQILAQAERYKVCDQCRSISLKQAGFCKVCGAYRFNEDPVTVRSTAKEMGAHPFPNTSAVVPRVS